jgi:hypothetical protein
MTRTILIIYLIGVILNPISFLLLYKAKRWDYTWGTLLFSIFVSWLSWILVLLNIVEGLKDKTLIKFDK